MRTYFIHHKTRPNKELADFIFSHKHQKIPKTGTLIFTDKRFHSVAVDIWFRSHGKFVYVLDLTRPDMEFTYNAKKRFPSRRSSIQKEIQDFVERDPKQ